MGSNIRPICVLLTRLVLLWSIKEPDPFTAYSTIRHPTSYREREQDSTRMIWLKSICDLLTDRSHAWRLRLDYSRMRGYRDYAT